MATRYTGFLEREKGVETSRFASPLPPRAQAYVDAVLQMCAESGIAMASVIVFGSAAVGGFSESVSDVDLILVLRDDASDEDGSRLRKDVAAMEIEHGFHDTSAGGPTRLEAFFERISANHRSFLICRRRDLLAGSVARILNVGEAQAAFVDRIVLPSIFSSAVTVWGEELLAEVALPPIRRFDVWKAFYGLANQVVVSVLLFPLFPRATKYAMGALKASVHNCFFCYESRRAGLEEEIAFFVRRYGPSAALEQLVALRRSYKKSFPFVLRCLPAMARLHWRAALDGKFQN